MQDQLSSRWQLQTVNAKQGERNTALKQTSNKQRLPQEVNAGPNQISTSKRKPNKQPQPAAAASENCYSPKQTLDTKR